MASDRDLLDTFARGLNIVGLLEASCGIGDAGRRYVEAAQATGTNLATFAFHMHGSPEEPYEHRGDGTLSHDTNLIVLNADLYLPFLAHAGQEFMRLRHNILLPFWELEELSPAFEVFRIVDEVWAASRFLADAYRAKTDRPVIEMPLPVRYRDGVPGHSRAEFGLPEGFVFLTTFDFASLAVRKNCAGVVAAFCRAFAPEEGPTLVLKTLNSHSDPNGIRLLRKQAGRRRDVIVLDGYLDDQAVSEMLGSADCYVSLHRSEGFGLTLAEAMAWGRPVIGTAYSGNLDFMTPDNSYLVNFDWSQVPHSLSRVYPLGARWAEPRIADAAAAMRSVYDDRREAARRGARGREDVRRTHSIDAVATRMADRLAQIRGLRRATPTRPGRRLASSKGVG